MHDNPGNRPTADGIRHSLYLARAQQTKSGTWTHGK
jgi:hypothetical protein